MPRSFPVMTGFLLRWGFFPCSHDAKKASPSIRAWERAWPVSARLVNILVLVNIGLQVCDGLATDVGLQRGIEEANPLVRYALDALGPERGLLLWKVEACVWIGLLRSLGARPLVAVALTITAGVYLSFSVVPWVFLLSS